MHEGVGGRGRPGPVVVEFVHTSPHRRICNKFGDATPAASAPSHLAPVSGGCPPSGRYATNRPAPAGRRPAPAPTSARIRSSDELRRHAFVRDPALGPPGGHLQRLRARQAICNESRADANKRDARARRSYHAGHDHVALPALRHPAAGSGALLGLQTFLDELRHMPQLPALGRRSDRLLRARSPKAATPRRRDPAVLGCGDRGDRRPRAQRWRGRCDSNAGSNAQLRDRWRPGRGRRRRSAGPDHPVGRSGACLTAFRGR